MFVYFVCFCFDFVFLRFVLKLFFCLCCFLVRCVLFVFAGVVLVRFVFLLFCSSLVVLVCVLRVLHCFVCCVC